MRYLILLVCMLVGLDMHAQTTLSLAKCEELFLKENFSLLAAEYNVSAANAAVVQARIWDNPYFSMELNALNPDGERNWDIGKNGQKAFAIQQLIYLGGKKRNQIALAKANADIAMLDFQDLQRNLKLSLRKSYFAVYFNNSSIKALDFQLANLDSLIKAYEVQVKKGNLPLRDQVRLQSLYVNILNDRTQLNSDNQEEMKTVKILLPSLTDFIPEPTEEEITAYEKPIANTIDALIQTASQSRPDLLAAQKNIEAAKFNLRWQKSLAIPDLTIGGSYDQRGGAFQNQVNMTLGIPLVLWNRNQGNIRQADAIVKSTESQEGLLNVTVKNEVIAAYNKWLQAKSNYGVLSKALTTNFGTVYNGVFENFQKRNIPMLEFTDFIESYTQSIIQFNEIRKAMVSAGEEINFTCNSKIF